MGKELLRMLLYPEFSLIIPAGEILKSRETLYEKRARSKSLSLILSSLTISPPSKQQQETTDSRRASSDLRSSVLSTVSERAMKHLYEGSYLPNLSYARKERLSISSAPESIGIELG
ncbi:uncharacterized protein PV09_07948 [Verruconis gallopava]|uniref:Uncharacterized protein n=1 Tax=Verruconis gallopava TaxID=253628 RepID=A0A0D1XEI8_9PEZI|nr:uncharacterized protein PV09_07948 [Verruconis gallopava]KIW00596.1 hypothetical protein PV09_07948 [Verruconis gallopava]